MYHHVCPQDKVPQWAKGIAQLGWSLIIEPSAFALQLRGLKRQGFKFVSMQEYVASCKAGHLPWGTLTVTFDDGWLDNYEYAFPILQDLAVPACIYVVSGEVPEVPKSLRLNDVQLREFAQGGVTIGGHSRSHPDLTRLSLGEMRTEISGCKDELEQRTGQRVEFFSYPGGRFNRAVIGATKEAGYVAACSVINGGANGKGSLYWLYRETLSTDGWTARDRVFLNRKARLLLNLRAQYRTRKILEANCR